jgi:hypothetical protein
MPELTPEQVEEMQKKVQASPEQVQGGNDNTSAAQKGITSIQGTLGGQSNAPTQAQAQSGVAQSPGNNGLGLGILGNSINAATQGAAAGGQTGGEKGAIAGGIFGALGPILGGLFK